jgi:RNA polymerase subunit RPABC4/transcription elongation factor Spt4
MIICQGCGQSFAVPAGYSRNKIQCPGCGVICAVPAGAAEAAPAPAARPAPRRAAPTRAAPPEEVEAVEWLRDPAPEEVPPVEAAPAAEVVMPRDEPSAPPPPPPKQRDLLFACRRCGRMIARQRECPVCDVEEPSVLPVEPGAAVPLAPTPAPSPAMPPFALELDERPARPPVSLELEEEEPEVLRYDDDLDEETTPYVLADKDRPICPKCQRLMERGAVLCTECGFNRKTRKKAQRTYRPMERTWDTGMPIPMRLAWFAGLQGTHMMLGGLSALVLGYWKPFVVTWPFLTLISAFILGTYDRITISRDRRGRATLTKRWFVLFVPLAPQATEVRGFEGVVTGQWSNPGCFEFFVLITLIPWGVIPALIYYYAAIHLPYFHVALAIDHGRPDLYVYRGRSLEQMETIRDFLCEAAELRHLG